MELQDWRKEPRKNYSNEFKLRMVELASQPGACVAQIARENGVNDNVIFKWLRLWQNEGRVSRRLPVTTSSDTGVELLPVEITPDAMPRWCIFRPGRRCGWNAMMTLAFSRCWNVLTIWRRNIPKLTAPVSAILAVAGVEHDWRANIRQTKSMGCCLAATMYPLAH